QPLSPRPRRARADHGRPSAGLDVPRAGALEPSSVWQDRFLNRKSSPSEVLERAIAEARRLASIAPAMGCLSVIDDEAALRDARASDARFEKGAPRSPLDGVIVPIKEELDLEGHAARMGTAYIPPSRAMKDATLVARLRAAGAIVIGQAMMTEWGMSPLGVNPHRPMPRNAHAPDRLAGGSSTGSAISVATGLAPLAIGSDGGGSIRIPACFNGVFGLKPTFGRVSRAGDGFGGTVDHVGPIAASTLDLATCLEIAAGEDPEDELTQRTPPVGDLRGALGRGVRGLRIGVLQGEIDAAAPEVASACREALAALAKEGAILADVELPLAAHASPIGYLTIGLETYASLLGARRDHFRALGPDLQLLLRIMSTFDAGEYLDAQSLRGTLRAQAAALLAGVDVLALPTTASEAPPIDAGELASGIADTPALAAACRFAFLGNLTGLPCGTAPIGSGAAGLPIGLQIVGDAFDEAAVLQVLAHLERIGAASTRAPRVRARPLG
ncbi:MAG: amidase, partial [Sandaracinaceae bacterium]|nr:amidase [Sandaracinaceae bacterium]